MHHISGVLLVGGKFKKLLKTIYITWGTIQTCVQSRLFSLKHFTLFTNIYLFNIITSR